MPPHPGQIYRRGTEQKDKGHIGQMNQVVNATLVVGRIAGSAGGIDEQVITRMDAGD
jgi:hypothetical protein